MSIPRILHRTVPKETTEQVEAALNNQLTALLAEGDAPSEAGDTEAAPVQAEKRVLAAELDAPKLQKVLAQSGVGSRRDIETWIAEGKIEVNGEPAHIGQRISWGDRVAVNGKPVKIRIAPPLPRVGPPGGPRAVGTEGHTTR